MQWLLDYYKLPGLAQSLKGGRRWKKYNEWNTNLMAQELYIFYANMWQNIFEWKTDIPTFNGRALERVLFFYGKAVFFQDAVPAVKDYVVAAENGLEAKYWTTPVNLTGKINLYNEFTEREAFAYDFRKNLRFDNSVLIRNNYSMTPSQYAVQAFTDRMVTGHRTLDMVLYHMRMQTTIVATEEERDSIDRYYNDINNFQPSAVVTRTFYDEERVRTIGGAPSTGTAIVDMWDHIHQLENQMNTRMGINNSNSDKKERLNVDETNANNQLIENAIGVMLDVRKEAAEQMSELAGIEITVDIRHKEEKHNVVVQQGGTEPPSQNAG